MYKHIFLDFDDTIYDTRGNATVALRELYEHFNLNRFFDRFETFSSSYWLRNHEVWALYCLGNMSRAELVVERFLYPLKQVGTGDEAMALALNDWFLDRTSEKSGLIEGALDLLEYLKPHYHLHIISNGFTEVQFRKLKSAGVDRYFEEIILSDAVGVNKPDPVIFEYALQKTGAKKEESIMIGDNFDTDITGAIRSRIDQIFFNPQPDFIAPVTPTFEVRKLEEIKEIL
ncbi:MAG: YjjG family noncanonical pyrimidine nucleotidase [Bacteroidales bacterium]